MLLQCCEGAHKRWCFGCRLYCVMVFTECIPSSVASSSPVRVVKKTGKACVPFSRQAETKDSYTTLCCFVLLSDHWGIGFSAVSGIFFCLKDLLEKWERDWCVCPQIPFDCLASGKAGAASPSPPPTPSPPYVCARTNHANISTNVLHVNMCTSGYVWMCARLDLGLECGCCCTGFI